MEKIIKSQQQQCTTGQSQQNNEIKDVFQRYKNAPIEKNDGLSYWKTMSMSENAIEKHLSKIAKYYMTPPPTSVDVERLFSIAGAILNQKRNRVIPENAEKLLFVRENLPRVNFEYYIIILLYY